MENSIEMQSLTTNRYVQPENIATRDITHSQNIRERLERLSVLICQVN